MEYLFTNNREYSSGTKNIPFHSDTFADNRKYADTGTTNWTQHKTCKSWSMSTNLKTLYRNQYHNYVSSRVKLSMPRALGV